MSVKWSDWNLPPGCFNSDPYFNDTEGELEDCEHGYPPCDACQREWNAADKAEARADEVDNFED
jgi:hypothetical protein